LPARIETLYRETDSQFHTIAYKWAFGIKPVDEVRITSPVHSGSEMLELSFRAVDLRLADNQAFCHCSQILFPEANTSKCLGLFFPACPLHLQQLSFLL
jgi:hypothetical protein